MNLSSRKSESGSGYDTIDDFKLTLKVIEGSNLLELVPSDQVGVVADLESDLDPDEPEEQENETEPPPTNQKEVHTRYFEYFSFYSAKI